MAEKDEEEYDDEYDDEEWDEDDEDWEDEDEEDDEEAEKAEAKEKRKKLLIKAGIGLGAVAMMVGLGYAAKLFGLTEAVFGKPNITEVSLELGKPVTHELPQIRTDLKRSGRRSQFIRMTIIVQLNEQDLPVLQDEVKTTEVLDSIKTHLRGLEFQDLQGKTGSERLRFELLNVINHTLAPVKAHTILFKDLLIQ